MIQTVKKYEDFAYNVAKLIESSNYKTKYFIESLDLSKPTFYRKMRDNTFTVKELGKIAELLYPQEFYEWKIGHNKEIGLKQYQEGEYVSAKETVAGLRQKLQNQ